MWWILNTKFTPFSFQFSSWLIWRRPPLANNCHQEYSPLEFFILSIPPYHSLYIKKELELENHHIKQISAKCFSWLHLWLPRSVRCWFWNEIGFPRIWLLIPNKTFGVWSKVSLKLMMDGRTDETQTAFCAKLWIMICTLIIIFVFVLNHISSFPTPGIFTLARISYVDIKLINLK